MKSLDTLVEDIYGVFDNRPSIGEERIEKFASALARMLSRRLTEERGEPSLRLSNLGTQCERKLWYSINTPEEAEQLRPETYLKFLYGDILEELLLFLAELAGHTVEGRQDEIEINGVKGHRDAIIDGVLVDCKSASSYSFNKFEEGLKPENDGFGYLDQLGAYLYGSRKDPLVRDPDRAAFLVIDKTLGKITLDEHRASERDYDKVVEDRRKLVTSDDLPPRGYDPVPDGKSGNLKLPIGCSYCPFKHTCWSDANNGQGLRTFIYSTGPVYLTNVKKRPRVLEVDKDGKEIPNF